MLPVAFPREAVRDLLGVTRALYRVENNRKPVDRRRLEVLRQIGHLLRDSLESAVKYPPDSMGRRTALSLAERATTKARGVRRGVRADGPCGRGDRGADPAMRMEVPSVTALPPSLLAPSHGRLFYRLVESVKLAGVGPDRA
jgi:hypothetical protein